MIIYPAIDIIEGKAVRLFKGDYAQKTEYGSPLDIAGDFISAGADHIHIVDLDGAKSGDTPNLELISKIAGIEGMFIEVGGGIRSLDVIKKYLDAGVSRVILGTAAVTDRPMLLEALKLYGDKIAVGADILDGKVRIKGWLNDSGLTLDEFLKDMEEIGVKAVICTDISKDGAMSGTNLALYKELKAKYRLEITASGGVSSIEDVKALKAMGMDAAIIGKAYYTGAIDLKEALAV